MKFVNLTPHAITLRSTQGDMVIEPDPQGPARVASTPGVLLAEQPEGSVHLHAAPTWGTVENLPAEKPGVVLVVSALVAGKCAGRKDVFSPGTGPADGCVREQGRIVAVTRLIQTPQA